MWKGRLPTMNNLLPPKRLWLLRHGETSWNEKGICLGRTDLSLSNLGANHVKSLKNSGLIDIFDADAVFSSPASRARETGDIIFNNSHYNRMFVNEGLQEIDFGTWDGLNWGDIFRKERYGWSQWLGNSLTSNPYNGETLLESQRRIVDFYNYIIAEKELRTILFIGHAGIFNLLLCKLLHRQPGVIWTYKTAPASISEILISPSGIVLSKFNHLPDGNPIVDIDFNPAK